MVARKATSRKANSAFHRQTPVFRKHMPGMRTKYNMLWFVVDMHHRQRYFFICGFKQIVIAPA